MAKGKHSTALFEVITKSNRLGSAPPAVVTRAPASVPTPAIVPSGPGESAVQLDPDRHQISLRVSYTSAVVTVFGILVVVTLSYLLGRGTNHSPQVANETTEELQKGPAHPSVLDVSAPAPNPAANVRQQTARAEQASYSTSGPIAAPTNVKRNVGQNYVIFQSYPDESTAKEAQAAALEGGISCTIEKGLPGWGPSSWWSVLGTQPFDHITHNPQLDSYLKAIESLKYAEKSKFKKFEPRAYKWK